MLRLGDYNTLRIVKSVDFGLYLDGGEEGDILLPQRYVTKDMHIGDDIEVFIYLDQEVGKPVWSLPEMGTDEGSLLSVP